MRNFQNFEMKPIFEFLTYNDSKMIFLLLSFPESRENILVFGFNPCTIVYDRENSSECSNTCTHYSVEYRTKVNFKFQNTKKTFKIAKKVSTNSSGAIWMSDCGQV